MKTDSQGLATHYDFQFVLQALKDYKIYLQTAIYIGYVHKRTLYTRAVFLTFTWASFVIPGYAIALFTPTIINELGFSAANAQLLSVPPFVAGCICVILVGIFSDRHRLRGPYVVGGAFAGLVGLIVLYTEVRPGAALIGIVLATMGIYSSIPVTLAWVSSNAGGDIKRGVAIAMVNGLGNIGG